MRWRNNKSFVIGAASFIGGCIFTLLLCSSNDSARESKRNSELQRLGEEVKDENRPQILGELDEEESIERELNNLPVSATSAPKPTLPPYPPPLKGNAMFLSPSGYNEDAFLVIIVVTTGRNFEARKAIRSSWGKSFINSNSSSTQETVQVFFVVGCDEVNDKRVEKESKTFRDILRGNFLDTYVQNELHTVKTLLGIKWATTMSNPQYILKVNSESFVNVHETVKWLHSLRDSSEPVVKPQEGLYSGYCHSGVKAVRNPQSPYFIPENQWSDALLPVYGSGIGVVLSRDVAEKMVRFARQMKMIHIDDVFLGVMAQNLSVECRDESSRFDVAYTTMLTECGDLHFCVLGSVPAKDMFYLSQNVDNLRDICNQETKTEKNFPADLFYV